MAGKVGTAGVGLGFPGWPVGQRPWRWPGLTALGWHAVADYLPDALSRVAGSSRDLGLGAAWALSDQLADDGVQGLSCVLRCLLGVGESFQGGVEVVHQKSITQLANSS